MTCSMNKDVAMRIINDLLSSKNLEIHVIDESRPFNDYFDLILKINCKYRLDEIDIWRENLKAWTLKRAKKDNHIAIAAKYRINTLPNEKKVELFTDDLQKIGSHYKGEF